MTFNPNNHPHVIEIYEVVKTVDVELQLAGIDPNGTLTRLRIEILRDMRVGDLSARGYIEDQVVLRMQPTLPERSPNLNAAIWFRYDLPYAEGNDVDELLEDILSMLRMRCV